MPSPQSAPSSVPTLRTLEDLAALAQANGAPVLKVHLENDIHLVSLEPGRLEFRPSARAPKTLAADLAQKLKDWTGTRWVVTLAREGGAPTLAEQKKAAKAARHERVLQEPLVRAVLDRFPAPRSSRCAMLSWKTSPRRCRKTTRNDNALTFTSPCGGRQRQCADAAAKPRRVGALPDVHHRP